MGRGTLGAAPPPQAPLSISELDPNMPKLEEMDIEEDPEAVHDSHPPDSYISVAAPCNMLANVDILISVCKSLNCCT